MIVAHYPLLLPSHPLLSPSVGRGPPPSPAFCDSPFPPYRGRYANSIALHARSSLTRCPYSRTGSSMNTCGDNLAAIWDGDGVTSPNGQRECMAVQTLLNGCPFHPFPEDRLTCPHASQHLRCHPKIGRTCGKRVHSAVRWPRLGCVTSYWKGNVGRYWMSMVTMRMP